MRNAKKVIQGLKTASSLIIILLILCSYSCSQTENALPALIAGTAVVPQIVYAQRDGKKLTLDAYIPAKNLGQAPWTQYTSENKPTLLYFHGGGWSEGDKAATTLFILPYLQRGWCVISANYRLLNQRSNLINCVTDSKLALAWIYDNAGKYKFDTTRIVVSGESAGGHLALMSAFEERGNYFENADPIFKRKLPVCAVVNWYGITDVSSAVSYWKNEQLSELIIGRDSTVDDILRLVSPIHYANDNKVPIISFHGDKDINVPIAHSEVLHSIMRRNKIRNKLIKVKGKKHGNFDEKEIEMAFSEIWTFIGEEK